MGYRVSVPTLRQHGHRDHAANALPEPAGFADRVEGLAQQVGIGDVVGWLSSPPLVLDFELCDLIRCHVTEFVAEALSGLQGGAVDKECARLVDQPTVLHIAKEGEGAVAMHLTASGLRLRPTGDPVVDELRDSGVTAHYNERRVGRHVGCLPHRVGALVTAVEEIERLLEVTRYGQILACAALERPALGELVLDPVPQLEHDRGGILRQVIRGRDARHFDDPRFDGVDEREVRCHPGEQPALAVAGALEEERCRREVVDGSEADGLLKRLKSREPGLRCNPPAPGLLLIVSV